MPYKIITKQLKLIQITLMHFIRGVSFIPKEALLYRCIGKTELAISDCNKSIEINPKSELPYIAKGNVYIII